jgi:hypothetical protein
MIAAGISPDEVDAWVADVGTPTQFSYLLAFAGNTFTHSEETPDMAMQVGELGTFELSGTQLVLSPASPATSTPTPSKRRSRATCFRFGASTRPSRGHPKPRRRIGASQSRFYCSAPFRRQP